MAVPEQKPTRRSRVSGKGADARVRVPLSGDELATLELVAEYYDRAWGRFRHVVRLLSGRQTRERFRRVSREGGVLLRFVQAERARQRQTPTRGLETVEFTPLALVAFWGRLLSSLASRRSRRKLASEELSRRESLAELFTEAARALRRTDAPTLEAAIASRRLTEQSWMRARLEREPDDPSRDT